MEFLFHFIEINRRKEQSESPKASMDDLLSLNRNVTNLNHDL